MKIKELKKNEKRKTAPKENNQNKEDLDYIQNLLKSFDKQ